LHNRHKDDRLNRSERRCAAQIDVERGNVGNGRAQMIFQVRQGVVVDPSGR